MFITKDNQVLGIMPELERLKWSQTFPDAQTFYWHDADGFADAFAEMAAALPEGTVGVEGLSMRAFELHTLQSAFGSDRIKMADELLSSLRLHKSHSDIDAMQDAIRISEVSLHEVLDALNPGLTEQDIVARLKIRMLKNGADGFAFDPLVLIGENAALPHGEPGNRRLQPGDALLIDFGASFNGLNADITRTFFYEKVAEEDAALYEAVLAANTHGRAIASPAKSAHELDTAVTAVLQQAGLSNYIVHKTGHGLGWQVHEPPQVMIGNHTQLEPGTVITIEPGLYRPGKLGIRIEDDVLITDDGNMSLTSFPRDLQILKN